MPVRLAGKLVAWRKVTGAPMPTSNDSCQVPAPAARQEASKSAESSGQTAASALVLFATSLFRRQIHPPKFPSGADLPVRRLLGDSNWGRANFSRTGAG